jgi:hypothetical protein
MKLLLLLLMPFTVVFSQSRVSSPVPDIAALYYGYENPVLFTNVSPKLRYSVQCANGAIRLKDSIVYVRPFTLEKPCTLTVYDQSTKKRIGWFEVPVKILDEPMIFFDSIPSGGMLSGQEQWLRCGYDARMNIRFVKYKVLNHQVFIENRAPHWVNPGGGITDEEAEELNKLSKDMKRTKVRFVLQVMDHNGVISNRGAEFEI